MAAVIYTDLGNVSWYVDDKKPLVDINRVACIQADGHELMHIQHLFKASRIVAYSIPMPNRPVVRWYGDIAKTIVYALA